MTNRNEEYRRRFNQICEDRSLVQAAEALNLPYTALSKWYHDNRDAFPPDVREEIRANGGRRVLQSSPVELRAADPTETEDLQSAGRLVDAIFEKFKTLREENEKLRAENEMLRAENGRLATMGSSVDRLLAEALH